MVDGREMEPFRKQLRQSRAEHVCLQQDGADRRPQVATGMSQSHEDVDDAMRAKLVNGKHLLRSGEFSIALLTAKNDMSKDLSRC
jgi:hypothetical protein